MLELVTRAEVSAVDAGARDLVCVEGAVVLRQFYECERPEQRAERLGSPNAVDDRSRTLAGSQAAERAPHVPL
jgi:hypothetical protein